MDYVRFSVTDRCNYRCSYCMPSEGVVFQPRDELLTYEEMLRLSGVFVALGIRRVRITGGEPLTRRNLIGGFIEPLAQMDGIEDIAMTTNGHLLEELAKPLAAAGLHRINISMDTVDPVLFDTITRGGDLERVIRGIDAAQKAGLDPIKLNMVVVRDLNEHQIVPMARFAARRKLELRYIEYMPIGVDEDWNPKRYVSVKEIRETLSEAYELKDGEKGIGGGPSVPLRAISRDTGEPGLRVGVIAPLTENFCAGCNRVRVTADGKLRECLSRSGSLSLRDAMRGGAADDDLKRWILESLYGKVESHQFGAAHGYERTHESMSAIGG